MKKTIIALALASATTLGVSNIAVAGPEFVQGCTASMQPAKEQGATDEQIAGFCTCLDGQIGDNADAIANLEAAAGDPEKWNDANKAAMKTCSPQQ